MKPVSGSVNAGGVVPDGVDALDAYERVRKELEALREDELAPVNLDIMFGVTTVLGCVSGLRRFRAELARLPGFELERFDKLDTYARAAGHAHAVHLRATSSPDITALVEAATNLRETLLADATALARRGLIGARSLTAMKGSVGHRNLAFDLSALSSALGEAWSRVNGKTAITMAELREARALADRLLAAVSLREQASSSAGASAIDRQRAFTLFMRAYDQTRRAFTYLRWEHSDVDELVPSLYERRAALRKATRSPPGASVVASANAEGPTEPRAPRAPNPNARMRSAAPRAGAGMPGGSPFEET